MKLIPLKNPKGLFTLIDDSDYEQVSKYVWYGTFKNASWYVRGWVNSEQVSLHRFITGLSKTDGLEVDHRNHNTLDNQRINLRVTTRKFNGKNRRKYKATASRYKGVQYRKSRGKWITVIRCDNKLRKCGSFNTEEDAAKAYNHKALELFGEFAYVNKI